MTFEITTAMLVMALFPIIISPAMMFILRVTIENDNPGGMFNPRTQSWAFMFGDSIFLPVSLGAAAYAVRASDSRWFTNWWWSAVAVAVATAATIGFRSMDTAAYKQAGNADRLNSPTKWWHDFVVYFSISYLMVLIGIPAITTMSVAGWITLAAFLGWLAMGICDMLRGLDPANMHPRVQDTLLARSLQ